MSMIRDSRATRARKWNHVPIPRRIQAWMTDKSEIQCIHHGQEVIKVELDATARHQRELFRPTPPEEIPIKLPSMACTHVVSTNQRSIVLAYD